MGQDLEDPEVVQTSENDLLHVQKKISGNLQPPQNLGRYDFHEAGTQPDYGKVAGTEKEV